MLLSRVAPCALILALACAAPDAELIFELGNPQGRRVAFSGWYRIESSGDSVAIADSTPRSYEATALTAGDRVVGVVGKVSANDLDTLCLRILVNGRPELTGATARWQVPMQFSLSIPSR